MINLKIHSKEIYHKTHIRDSSSVADILNINEKDHQLSSHVNIFLGSETCNISIGIRVHR